MVRVLAALALSAALGACDGGRGTSRSTTNGVDRAPATAETNILAASQPSVPACAEGLEGWLNGFVVEIDRRGYWFVMKITDVAPQRKSTAPAPKDLVGQRIKVFNAWGLFYETQKRWIKDLSPGEHVRVKVRYTPQKGGMLMMRAQFRVRSPKDLGKLVFLGDSITHFWGDLGTDFPDYRIYNSGIAGDNTWGVLERLDYSCLDLSPRAVVVLIGTNDLVFRPLDQIKIEELVTRLRAHRATMPILLCRVMPRNPVSGVTDAQIRTLNGRIDALAARDPDIHLIDTYTPFLDTNGVWNAAYFLDGVHPNTDGYRVWAEQLRPVLTRVLQPF
jgi:lysophospholipase L1-like esterase